MRLKAFKDYGCTVFRSFANTKYHFSVNQFLCSHTWCPTFPPISGLVENVTNSSDVAMAVPECNVEGLYFIPAFTGLQAPINDAYARCGHLN